jgi:hypothetical protein
VQQVRQPAVAGTFYHSDRLVLQTNVNDLLETALLEANNEKQSENLIPPKAIIVPHALFAAERWTRYYQTRGIAGSRSPCSCQWTGTSRGFGICYTFG